MTSLVFAPNQFFLEHRFFSGTVFEESDFTTWRNLKGKVLPRNRLRNRSWIFMSEKLLNSSQKAIKKSFWTSEKYTFLQDTALARHRMSFKSSSIFLGPQKYKYHTVDMAQQVKSDDDLLHSGASSSDILKDKITSIDYHHYDHMRERKLPNQKLMRIPIIKEFQVSSSQQITRTSSSIQDEGIGEKFSRTEVDETEIDREACKSHKKNKIFYLSNSPTSQDFENFQSKSAPKSCSTSEKTYVALRNVKTKKSLFVNHADLSVLSLKDDETSSISSTDISEISDCEENVLGIRDETSEQAIQYTRFSKNGKISGSADDTESEWMSVSSESELTPESPDLQPISFAKRRPILKAIYDDLNNSPPAEDTLKNSPTFFQPRSLLSGLFLSEINGPSVRSPVITKNATIAYMAPKPILKRSSTTGVITIYSGKASCGINRPSILLSKRYASTTDFTNNASSRGSPILYISEEEPNKRGAISFQQRNLYTKQPSSVGLSNYSATAEVKAVSCQTGQKIGNCQSDQDSKGAVADNLLSSSLTKYRTSQSQLSLKKMFLKSSINLNSFLGSGITGKLRLNSDNNRSNEKIKSSTTPFITPPMASSFAEHLSQKNAMGPFRNDSTIASSQNVRVETRVSKGFMPSVNISKSLKDSLIIDYKLGKAPLPDRVITDIDLFSGYDKESFLRNCNDYHSSGW